MGKRRLKCCLIAMLAVLGMQTGAMAALFDVGPTVVTHNYPLWYVDTEGLKLDLCTLAAEGGNAIAPARGDGLCLLDLAAEPVNPITGVSEETFWWATEADLGNPLGSGLLVLAMEAAFDDVTGDPISFGRMRIRVDVDIAGTYTVTHPFGVEVFEVAQVNIGPGQEIRDDIVAPLVSSTRNRVGDFGCGVTPCNFGVALDSGIGPFLYWDITQLADDALPILGLTTNAPYIGDPAIPHTVLGSPYGTNYFRIDGPPGSLGGEGFLETNLFSVMGKVFEGDGNTAPVAIADAVAVLALSSVDIDVLANDTDADIPINQGSLRVSTAPANGSATVIVKNGMVIINYMPNPGFVGIDTFEYTARDFGGLPSVPMTVSVTVEDLQIGKADLRQKFRKWTVSGTSSDITANEITMQVGSKMQTAILTGAQMVPPATSLGSGTAMVMVSDDHAQIDFSVTHEGLVNVQDTHIHYGLPGVVGPALFTISPVPFNTVTGTLTALDLTPSPINGIVTFADAIQAILSGETYVHVHAQNSTSIRGQFVLDKIVGTATVQADQSWSISIPADLMSVGGETLEARSSNNLKVTRPVNAR